MSLEAMRANLAEAERIRDAAWVLAEQIQGRWSAHEEMMGAYYNAAAAAGLLLYLVEQIEKGGTP